MNTDLQNALDEAWPQIFRQKVLGPAITAVCCGIQCDDGLGRTGRRAVRGHDRACAPGAHAVFAATAVKQKFASLRVYFDQHLNFC
jgi:hypothetical protein